MSETKGRLMFVISSGTWFIGRLTNPEMVDDPDVGYGEIQLTRVCMIQRVATQVQGATGPQMAFVLVEMPIECITFCNPDGYADLEEAHSPFADQYRASESGLLL